VCECVTLCVNACVRVHTCEGTGVSVKVCMCEFAYVCVIAGV